ncbi:unnamed protein product [Peronospora belbahrii]|uniref:HTH psq-type domain-containing protein n=1 Tax=Peronospora belbahrii TaxID=622444 RepID=A0AAU9KPY6_9STRA|nr:unnamed protein product [Peronospora belbahrii]
MAPSDRLSNSSSPMLDRSESLVASNDYQVFLHSRQPFVHYEHRRRLQNTDFPTRDHVERLPGVATLLQRHDTMHLSEPMLSVRDPSYDLQCRSFKTTTLNNSFECWTPPSLTGRPSSITSPAFKFGPLTAALNTMGGRYTGWSSNLVTNTNEMLKNQTADANTWSPVKWSPERVSSPATDDKSRSKGSRYLREIDRRHILMRIAQGEKQSALAKEYHVSRAAICNLNKHRAEVLSRNHEHPLAKHPKRRMGTRPKRHDMIETQVCQ